MRSKIAPAVLGLESAKSRVGLLDKGTGWSRSVGDTADTIEDMLPETECPGRAVAVLDVSLDTSDNGLGIYSSLSENPTRFLPGLACLWPLLSTSDAGVTGVSGMDGPWSTVAGRMFSNASAGSGNLGGWSWNGIGTPSLGSKAVGLLGALPLLGIAKSGNGARMGRSLVEMAPETPRRCPRRGGGASPGDANPLSDLVGLVLMTAIEFPSRILPPTNSLPPLRCPCPTGREGDASGLEEFGVTGGLRSVNDSGSGGKDAPGLKLNAGRATLLRCLSLLLGGESNGTFWGSMADIGRRPLARVLVVGTWEGEGIWAGKTNGGFGGGASS